MNNIETSSGLLEFFKNILSNNTNISLTDDMIYDSIIKINVPEEQLSVEIDSLFDEWKTKFAALDIKVNDDYLEINNKLLKVPSPLKVYISMDCNHIYKNINKIVNFLNDTPFQLRISKYIRNDNVIIRLSSIEDLIKLDKFIDDNIDDGLFDPNPFTFVYNKLGITIDGSLSFNSIISNCLYKYLISKKDDYNTIQIDDFYNYIIDLYTNTFITLNNYSNMEIPNIDNILFEEKSIVYYKNLLELILKSSEDKFNIKQLEDHFNKVNDIKELAFDKLAYKTYNSILLLKIIYKDQIPNLLDRLYKYIETGEKNYITNEGSLRINIYISNLKEGINKVLKKNDMNLADLFNKLKTYDKDLSVNTLTTSKDLQELIKELSETYDYKTAIDIIQVYLHTNDVALFTRNNNLRKKIVDNSLRNNIISVLLEKKLSFSEYCDKLEEFILEDKKQEKEIIEDTQNYDLDNHFDITSIMVSAIKDDIEDKGYTEQINIDIKEEELEQPTTLIEENTMSVEDLFDEINDEDKTVNVDSTSIEKLFDKVGDSDKTELLTSAIKETYKKYEELFKEGKIKFDGFALVNYALTSILEKDDYTSFTRINEARKNISLLTKQDILDIMCNSLGIESTIVDIATHEYLQEIIRNYIDYLLEAE